MDFQEERFSNSETNEDDFGPPPVMSQKKRSPEPTRFGSSAPSISLETKLTKFPAQIGQPANLKESLELNANILLVLYQLRELNATLPTIPECQLRRQSGWMDPKAQLEFLRKLSDFAFGPLVAQCSQTSKISQDSEQQHWMTQILHRLKEANDRVLNIASITSN